jgi:hypothetical protein
MEANTATVKRSGELVKVSYTHDAMIDLIIQEPTVRVNELAELFNYSPAWVSRILASDSFQARLAQRKSDLIDPLVAQSLNERMRGVAIHAVTIIGEKLEAEESASYAIDALGIAATALSNGPAGRR